MKRWIAAILAGMFWIMASGACSESVSGDAELMIKENTFVFQLMQMENAPKKYTGKTVQLEGLFGTSHYGEGTEEQTEYKVYRYYPGDCCSAYTIGLEVRWPQDSGEKYPENGTWVRAEGLLETYDDGGTTYLRVLLSALDVSAEPGAIFVTESTNTPIGMD